MELHEQPRAEVDWFIFIVGTLMLFAVVIPIIVAPEWSTGIIDLAFTTITTRFGVLFILMANVTLIFLVWLALSSWGTIVLGPQPAAKPAYSRFAWASMLFCTGIGASLVYWGAMEWVYYYTSPPFGIEARGDEAIRYASSYGIFHWGPMGWALYCLPAIALGCSYHLHRIPTLRLSAACSGVLGEWSQRWPGRIIDLLFIIGLLGTAATGLGLGTSVVSSSVTELTGLKDGFGMQLAVISVVTLIIAFSVYQGLDKGIKVLSTFNASLALILIAFVFIAGPSGFILEMGITAVGTTVQNFFRMATWTDPLMRSNFVESWTVFYWAWWIALGPFVGMFVCKISEGRTIREVIFGMLGWGTLGCGSFFIVLGNYALFLELEGIYPVVAQVEAAGPSAAIASIIGILPAGDFWLVYLSVIGLIFTATTYDSASYTLAAGASRHLAEHEHPRRWHRVFWAVTLGLLPTSLLFVGGLRALQTASITASLPLLAVYGVMFFSIVRMLRRHVAEQQPNEP